MPWSRLRRSMLGIAAALASAAPASAQSPGDPLRVREVGSYHVGGKEVVLSGLPTQEISFKGVPHLFLFGDHLADHPLWPRFVSAVGAHRDNLLRAGAVADWVSLPDRGITGNTHMLMMDRNSDQVAALVQDWMAKQGLMR